MEYPTLIKTGAHLFAPDAIARAQKYLDHVTVNGTGSSFFLRLLY